MTTLTPTPIPLNPTIVRDTVLADLGLSVADLFGEMEAMGWVAALRRLQGVIKA